MLKLKIITPERIMLETDAESLTLPTQMGEITVLPKHIPLVANLSAGEICFRKEGKEEFFSIAGGIIEVKGNGEVVVLADAAEFGHEIDVERAEAARERARKMMQQFYVDEKSYADAVTALEKQLARLKVARKHRTHTHKNLESGVMNQ